MPPSFFGAAYTITHPAPALFTIDINSVSTVVAVGKTPCGHYPETRQGTGLVRSRVVLVAASGGGTQSATAAKRFGSDARSRPMRREGLGGTGSQPGLFSRHESDSGRCPCIPGAPPGRIAAEQREPDWAASDRGRYGLHTRSAAISGPLKQRCKMPKSSPVPGA